MNQVMKGQRWDKRLSVLKEFSAAQNMPIWAEEIKQAGAVAIMVDNFGFVWGYRKGCGRTEYIIIRLNTYKTVSVVETCG